MNSKNKLRFLIHGAAGIVINGEWFEKKAAFKFVEIGNQKVAGSLKTLNEKISEMISGQSTVGSQIVPLYGHYR